MAAFRTVLAAEPGHAEAHCGVGTPEVAEYFRHCEEEPPPAHRSPRQADPYAGEIFPNTALLPRQPRTIAVWHPRGPNQTEVWRWFLVDRDAPAEVGYRCWPASSESPA